MEKLDHAIQVEIVKKDTEYFRDFEEARQRMAFYVQWDMITLSEYEAVMKRLKDFEEVMQSNETGKQNGRTN